MEYQKFPCDAKNCGKKFQRRENLRRHMERFHGLAIDSCETVWRSSTHEHKKFYGHPRVPTKRKLDQTLSITSASEQDQSPNVHGSDNSPNVEISSLQPEVTASVSDSTHGNETNSCLPHQPLDIALHNTQASTHTAIGTDITSLSLSQPFPSSFGMSMDPLSQAPYAQEHTLLLSNTQTTSVRLDESSEPNCCTNVSYLSDINSFSLSQAFNIQDNIIPGPNECVRQQTSTPTTVALYKHHKTKIAMDPTTTSTQSNDQATSSHPQHNQMPQQSQPTTDVTQFDGNGVQVQQLQQEYNTRHPSPSKSLTSDSSVPLQLRLSTALQELLVPIFNEVDLNASHNLYHTLSGALAYSILKKADKEITQSCDFCDNNFFSMVNLTVESLCAKLCEPGESAIPKLVLKNYITQQTWVAVFKIVESRIVNSLREKFSFITRENCGYLSGRHGFLPFKNVVYSEIVSDSYLDMICNIRNAHSHHALGKFRKTTERNYVNFVTLGALDMFLLIALLIHFLET